MESDIDNDDGTEDYIPIVVYSHVRWAAAERLREVFTRLAEHRRVLFIEEPVFDPPALSTWTRETPAEGVTVLRPATAVQATGFDDGQLPALQRMVRDVLIEEGVTSHLAWLTTPTAQPLAQSVTPVAGIYDATDERTEALEAPPTLAKREADLLQWADLVFTGSPSVYRAKRGRHSSVHYFPSSVDLDRLERAGEGIEPTTGTAPFTSWDATVEAMDDLIAVLERGYRPKSGVPPARVAPVTAARTPPAPAPHARA